MKEEDKIENVLQKRKKHNLGRYVGIFVFIVMVIVAAFVGGWFFCVRPIIGCVMAIMAGTFSWVMAVLCILEILIAIFVVAVLIFAGGIVGKVFDTLLNLDDD